METNSEILIFDLLIQKKDDLSLTFSVFRKSTHTNKHLSIDSYNPLALNHKIATSVTLFHCASTLCSKENLTQELKTVKMSMEINGHNKNIIKFMSQDN